MERLVGTVSRGVRAPIIRKGDDLASIVVDSVLAAAESEGFALRDRDVVAVTEAVVARAQGNYASIDQIAKDVHSKFGEDTVGVIFPILSRNRFAICLKGIAKGCRKIVLMLSYPSDEVGNHLIDEEEMDEKGVNPWTDVLTEEKYRELFGYKKHVFTGVDYVEYYKQLIQEAGAEVEIIFANHPKAILNYTGSVLTCDIHSRFRTKNTLLKNGAKKVYTLDEIMTESVDGSGYNDKYGLLGSNKATEETVKLFPIHCQEMVDEIQKRLIERIAQLQNPSVVGLDSLLDYIPTLVQPGEITARHYYGTDGWVCHTSNNPFGETQPGWGIVWGHFPGAAAWLCRHLWDHYLYTQDTAFLKEIYPTIKGAAQFWVDWLIEDETGHLISSPSYSPEHGTVSAGASMDFQIAHEILKTVVSASEILETDEREREDWRSCLKRIPQPKIGRWGQLQEWAKDIDSKTNKHRHISHLYALHPGTQISPITTPELAKAAAVTLKARGDKGTGWSMAWKMNFHARLGNGDHSYRLLRNFVKPTSRSEIALSGGGFYKNLWDAHPPFQIDGNFGLVSAFIEWLLQSGNGEIHLLPALPSAIASGRFSGFKAAGGFTVSASWEQGQLTEAVIRSDAGKPLTVRYAGKTIDIELQRGESVRLNGNPEILFSER